MFLSTLEVWNCNTNVIWKTQTIMSNGQIAKKIRYTYIYPPALIAWISHSVGENNVSPKSLDNLIDFLQQSVQCRTKWSTWYTKYCSKPTLTYPLYSVVIQCGINCTTPTLKTIINLCRPNWAGFWENDVVGDYHCHDHLSTSLHIYGVYVNNLRLYVPSLT
jgi:hypothetical protein